MILEQYDPEINAVINPSDVFEKIENMPKVAICCYSYKTFNKLAKFFSGEIITELTSANGASPIYRIKYKEKEFALFMNRVGAPMSVGTLEDVYQMGIEKVIIFGSCGVLDKSIKTFSIILPDSAIRDEGTSYHYLPASEEIAINSKYLDTLKKLLDELEISYIVGKTWTIDAFYRETEKKVALRKEQGCICVEMEASANESIAQFRKKDIFQFFYAADNLDAEKWQPRSLEGKTTLDSKVKVGILALELANKISK